MSGAVENENKFPDANNRFYDFSFYRINKWIWCLNPDLLSGRLKKFRKQHSSVDSANKKCYSSNRTGKPGA